MSRRVLATLAVAATIAVGARPASAGPVLDRAAEALRRDPVYVDPAAERKISDAEADRLRDRIRDGGQPGFVAVLPGAASGEAGEDPGRLPVALGETTRLRGTYAVLAGNSFRAASNALPTGVAGSLATAAFQRHRDDGPAAVLLDFVDRVQQARSGAGSGSEAQARDESSDRGSGSGAGLLLVLLVLGAIGGGGFFVWRGRKRAREVKEARDSLRPELAVLADDVLALESQVTLHPEARADYDAAVSRYRSAEAALPQVRSVEQADRLRRVLAEGSYAMARVRARVDGREPPPPPPELARTGPNQEPAVVVDERGEPAYAGYGGGWYGGGGWFGGDLLTGILIGSALGGPGWGWGHDHGHQGGDGGGGDGGDQGGGDWGGDFGGDFGGGDFGGGDFGGGDFGGGGDF